MHLFAAFTFLMAAAAEAEELPDVPPVPAIEKLKTARGKPLIAVNGQYLMVQHKLTKDRTEMIWFYCTPRHFKQLYTFNAVTDSHSAPCIFMLLMDKRGATYDRAFAATFGHHALAGCQPRVILAGIIVL